MNERIKLAQRVRDAITGFEGIVVGYVKYMTGCHQALVQPRCKDNGDYVDSRWHDVDRLVVLEESAVMLPYHTTDGPDREAPKR